MRRRRSYDTTESPNLKESRRIYEEDGVLDEQLSD